ncbi:unnamed protein product [Haemonchus placei]|uniref:Ovule protein n=1 Tax=Haemonchus placei TaxID=6290 RepID=A0A0N4W5Q6_HAEPC|nr:unnamed protein product [Haemonchus placei]
MTPVHSYSIWHGNVVTNDMAIKNTKKAKAAPSVDHEVCICKLFFELYLIRWNDLQW